MSVDVTTRFATGATPTRQRALAPDLARGVMLLLIALAHAPALLFGQSPGFKGRPLGSTPLDHGVDFVMLVLVDNRAYPMFGVLFGYGMALMVSRQLASGTSEPATRRLLRRRALFLLAFGAVHAIVIGGADILAFYGLATLLSGWLLFRPDRVLGRALVMVGAVFVVLMPVIWITLTLTTGTGFPPVSPDQTYVGVVLERTIAFPFIPLVQLVAWPMIVGVLVGMWAARRRLLEQAGTHRNLLRRTVVIGLVVSVLGGLPGALIGSGVWEPSGLLGGVAVTLHVLTGLAGGFAYAAVFGLVGHASAGRTNPLTWALAALGKRSLTFYVMQEALLVIVLSPVVFGLGGPLDSTGGAVVAVLVWLLGLGFACLLERSGRPGPADHLLRTLVYRR